MVFKKLFNALISKKTDNFNNMDSQSSFAAPQYKRSFVAPNYTTKHSERIIDDEDDFLSRGLSSENSKSGLNLDLDARYTNPNNH